jgi:hypothetical protein
MKSDRLIGLIFVQLQLQLRLTFAGILDTLLKMFRYLTIFKPFSYCDWPGPILMSTANARISPNECFRINLGYFGLDSILLLIKEAHIYVYIYTYIYIYMYDTFLLVLHNLYFRKFSHRDLYAFL